MLSLYPLSDWRTVRQFTFALPPAMVVVAGAALASGRSLPAVGLRCAALAVFLFIAADSHRTLIRSRRATLAAQSDYSRFLANALRPYHPRLIIAPAAYRYGWDTYPVSVVVWDATDLPGTRAVDNTVRVDAVVVDKEKRRSFLGKIERGAYRGQYQ